MTQLWFAIAVATSAGTANQPFTVQFGHSLAGREVTVCIDGRIEKTFAGKLGFREENRSWQSVCADVRSPIREGQFYSVKSFSTAKVGGNYGLAGNIVSKYFRAAQTADQCAGLQLAVWKAIEDGEPQANFQSGHFQAQGNPSVMQYAQLYYQAVNAPGNAAFLYAGGNGQSQMSSDSI